MKFLQELTALSAAVYESIKELDLTPSQNRAIEREISDLLSAGKSQDIDVEVHHVQDEGDCYKAFYTFEDPKTGKDRHGSIYFKARILDHSVEDFEEKSFNESLTNESWGEESWGEEYEVTDENDPRSEVYFSGTRSECAAWIRQNKNNDQYKNCEFSIIQALDESRSFREEPIPPFAVCYSYDGVVHKDDVFMGSRAECLEYMRTHKAKKPFTFDLMDTDSGRLVSYSLKEAGRTCTIKKSGVAPHGAPEIKARAFDVNNHKLDPDPKMNRHQTDESLNESFARAESMLRGKMISRVEGFFGDLQSLRYDQLNTEDLAKIFFTLVEKNLVKSVIIAGFGEVAKAEDLERFLGA